MAAFATSASALTVTESTDFSGNFSLPTFVGTLDLGSNTVSGSLSGTCESIIGGYLCGTSDPNGSPDLVDAFSFDVGAGLELYSAVLSITNHIGYSAGSSSTFDTRSYPGNGSNGPIEMMFGGPVTGTHTFEISSLIVSGELNYSMDYSLELFARQVPAVPLPAGGLLLLTAGGLLAGMRGRKSA